MKVVSLLVALFLIMSTAETLPTGFVYLHDIIPDIQVSLRYASEENFLGSIVDGYLANVSIVTEPAGLALKQAQELAKAKGYELVIYDSYRPQKGVDHFVRWSEDPNDLQRKKDLYYPRTNKEEAFDLGYIARKSGHTRGSTIDLTIIPIGKRVLNPLTPKKRILNDNSMILFLDDGTVDMGSSFDLMDEASYTNSTLINEDHQQMRMMFKDIMEQAGFINYQKEWWHYTLQNEPFPETYFDFDVK
jgi:D-alanyl-D-alanine dipeptidase